MRAPREPNIKAVSHCAVDANGVQAEWVEAAVATPGQPTIIYLVGSDTGYLETVRPVAVQLAITTGARVLTVHCVSASNGVTAYAWLLGEGLELETTTFHGAPNDQLPDAVCRQAERLGLPVPSNQRLPFRARSIAAVRETVRMTV